MNNFCVRRRIIVPVMKNRPVLSTPEHERFTKALASVLSVSAEELREKERATKPEPPSPHKRYSYDPAKGQS